VQPGSGKNRPSTIDYAKTYSPDIFGGFIRMVACGMRWFDWFKIGNGYFLFSRDKLPGAF
jgi:hypothetical protein